jgi:hypothetical protein
MTITWAQALAWRMRRHLLEPVGRESVPRVVARLGAVPAMDEGLAELAVRTRRWESKPGEVADALAHGRIVKSFAFRGATHYLSAGDAGAYLALRAAGRQWELPSWQKHYGLKPTDWPGFRETVREALVGGPLTVTELGDAVSRKSAYRHLRPVFDDGAGTLLKPLTWLGDMSFGPLREGRHTFQRLDDNPHWAGIWDLDEAGPHAIASYFRTYGPATDEHIHYWLGEGLSAGRGRLNSWLAAFRDRLTAVEIGGEASFVLTDDAEELAATPPTHAVRLLPGHDQWVIGPSTKDEHIVAPSRRTPVTCKANVVIAGGVLSGTWGVKAEQVRLTWFGEHGKPPLEALEEQVARLAAILDRPLGLSVDMA